MKFRFAVIALMLFAFTESNGQTGQSFWQPYVQTIPLSWTSPLPTSRVERVVVDRFSVLSFKYDTREVKGMDSLSRIDPNLPIHNSYKVELETPWFYLYQRLKSDTLVICKIDSINYIKIKDKVYKLK